MAIGDIALTSSARDNVLQLGRTKSLLGRTQDRLASGREVNSALDNATAFFQSTAFTDRANDLASLKDGISVGIRALEATDAGLTAIVEVVKQLQGVITSARQTTDANVLNTLEGQYDDLLGELDELAGDTSFNGTNLLNNDAAAPTTLTIFFNETNTTQLDIAAVNVLAAGLGLEDSATLGGDFGNSAQLDDAADQLRLALGTLRAAAQGFGDNATLLQTRQTFIDNLNNALVGGADDLTLANIEEEGANAKALETRQRLGIISLSISTQSEQGVVQLF